MKAREIRSCANLLYLPTVLPDGVFFVVSSRPTSGQIFHRDAEHKLFLDKEERNLCDIRLYLESWLQRDGIVAYRRRLGTDDVAFVDLLTELSQGNFMYLSYVLPEIEKGSFKDRDLPQGLEKYYEDHWDLLKNRDIEVWSNQQLPILGALAASSTPVSTAFLSKISEVRSPAVIREHLQEWRQFLEIIPASDGNETLYQLYHESFRDFLEKKIDLREVKKRASRAVWREIPKP